MSAAWAAMSVATSRSPRAALHWYPARRLPSSASTQSTASRQPGPFQCSHRAAASRAKYAACRSRVGSRAPVSAKPVVGELADGLEEAVPGARGGVVGDHERLADQRVEMSEHVDVVGAVDHRADAREVEAAREHRRQAEQLALVVVQQVVRPRHRVAERELSLRPRRRAPATAGIDRRAGPGPRPRSWRPCARRPARFPAGARRGSRRSRSPRRPCRGSPSPKSGRTARARSTNSVTASEVSPPSSASGGTVNTVSPSSMSVSRDVARILTFRGPAEHRGDGRARGGEDVLAVVHHQQEPPPGQATRRRCRSAARRPAA